MSKDPAEEINSTLVGMTPVHFEDEEQAPEARAAADMQPSG